MKNKKLVIIGCITVASLFAIGGLAIWGKAYLEEQKASALRSAEASNVRQLLLGLRIYAADNGGKFPAKLDDLYPDYIDSRSLFSAPEPGAGNRNPYRYVPGHTDKGRSNTPILISPNVYQPGGKTIVGYLGGHVMEISASDPTIKSHFPAN